MLKNAFANLATEPKQDIIIEDLEALDSTLTDGSQISKIKETTPIDTTKVNGQIKVYKNAIGETVKIEKIIGATTYTKLIVPMSADTTIVGYDTIGVWI